jgi:hypothetical protein
MFLLSLVLSGCLGCLTDPAEGRVVQTKIHIEGRPTKQLTIKFYKIPPKYKTFEDRHGNIPIKCEGIACWALLPDMCVAFLCGEDRLFDLVACTPVQTTDCKDSPGLSRNPP